jgi:hypothetical protein
LGEYLISETVGGKVARTTSAEIAHANDRFSLPILAVIHFEKPPLG